MPAPVALLVKLINEVMAHDALMQKHRRRGSTQQMTVYFPSTHLDKDGNISARTKAWHSHDAYVQAMTCSSLSDVQLPGLKERGVEVIKRNGVAGLFVPLEVRVDSLSYLSD
jgi:hypothetical protein